MCNAYANKPLTYVWACDSVCVCKRERERDREIVDNDNVVLLYLENIATTLGEKPCMVDYTFDGAFEEGMM